MVIYDSDGDGLIEIRTLAQLNAVRWDVDGDGLVTDNVNTADIDEAAIYEAAFPQAAIGMGCPSGCTGYELMVGPELRRGRRRRRGRGRRPHRHRWRRPP